MVGRFDLDVCVDLNMVFDKVPIRRVLWKVAHITTPQKFTTWEQKYSIKMYAMIKNNKF